MNTLDLLAELKRLNVKVSLAGDKLRLEAPAGVLTPASKEAIAKHKVVLVALLSGLPVEVLFWPEELEAVERERARRRQATSTGGAQPQLKEKFPEAEKGQTRDKVAAAVGLGSGRTYDKAAGVKSNVYRARQTCLGAEGCLQLTREVDCRLFPLTWCWGWCRERVSANDQRALNQCLVSKSRGRKDKVFRWHNAKIM